MDRRPDIVPESTSKMRYLDPQLRDFLASTPPAADPVRAEMEAYAKAHRFPMVGPLIGQLLEMMAKATNASRIFELGSGFGYSALWFGRGLRDGGQIFCTDSDPKNVELARRWLLQAGVLEKVTYLQGLAVEELHNQRGDFDIIYNDIDKYGYPEAFEVALERLRVGGMLITDNTIWSMRIFDESDTSADTEGIREYNRLTFNTPGVRSFMIPVRDGVTMSVKL